MNTYQAITTLWPLVALEVAFNPESLYQHSTLLSPRAQAQSEHPLNTIGTYGSDQAYFAQVENFENVYTTLLAQANVSGGWRVDVLSQLEQAALDHIGTGTLHANQIHTLQQMQNDFAPLQEIDPENVAPTALLQNAQQIVASYFTPNGE